MISLCFPYWLLRLLGNILGFLLYICVVSRRRLVLSNLSLTTPFKDLSFTAKKKLSKRIFKHSAIMFLELLCLSKFNKQWKKRLIIDPKLIRKIKQIKKERGIILVSAHYSNWELLSYLPQSIGEKTRCLAVAQDIKNPYIDRWIKKSTYMVTKKGFLKVALKWLKKKKVICLLADQYAGEYGIDTNFLGKKTKVHTSPAVLSERTGSPIILIYVEETKNGRYFLSYDKILEPNNYDNKSSNFQEKIMLMTVDQIKSLESKINKQPEKWFWLHNRWKK